jgi:hypothetical protein
MPRALRRSPELLLLCGLLLLLQGCNQWRYDIGQPLAGVRPPDADRQTQLRDVLLQLGPPQRLSRTANGYVMAWEHWLIREDSLGFSLGFLGADLLSVDWGDARVSGEFLLLSFDREHRLVSSDFASWDGNAGGGAAVQPVFGVVSVVDVDDLTERMPQHDWGRGNLLRLPEAINAPWAPDLGSGGIEQRGTPTGVGQRSLEMD